MAKLSIDGWHIFSLIRNGRSFGCLQMTMRGRGNLKAIVNTPSSLRESKQEDVGGQETAEEQ